MTTEPYVHPYIAKREKEIDAYKQQAEKHESMAKEFRDVASRIRGEIDSFKKEKGLE